VYSPQIFNPFCNRLRKTNIIIHGLQESSASDRDIVHQQDENSIINLLHELKCDDVSVNAVTRLGRKMEAEDAKPRPVKVVLASEEQKDKILRMSKNLHHKRATDLERIFIHQDLTPERKAKGVCTGAKATTDARTELNYRDGTIIETNRCNPANHIRITEGKFTNIQSKSHRSYEHLKCMSAVCAPATKQVPQKVSFVFVLEICNHSVW